MKAILVIDMPENCFKCKLQDWANCRIVKGCHTGDTRPDWCPLKPMPEKKKERYGMNRQTSTGHWETYGEETDSVATGYNACIDEILGDKE